ncbi:hypothetical protein NS274_08770 [Pseudomonas oryzihabitans]|uniref:DUF4136 domain-containing protein n=1 Tax=Pseudomonas rhizoryzae TaxID=2571129 RepID=UPI0007377A11|nr:DUF4136 domain-containing protein [Pseudomonas rhizoryzae]APQ13765.1 hypothetical protein BJP27_20545 [Pseudomonas psychrotolerans]KTS78014.1 hypothetical protein NS274_08770 [Pseudomonas psychrotolerans]KTT14248.1 hypothetical protein NS2R_00980 [Pseudomonas psychrotolerans]KTT34952.1 hypothetical protein NS201_02045 [Pseudomonas psychrotolerans]KTT36256.1 hypothetical protein SB9_06900 [Pseudomonas psychrotolerans]
MRRPLLCLSLALFALAGCQGSNPYVASALPQASAPVLPQQDPAAYPATPIDWGRFRSWAWAPGAALISGGLDSPTLQRAVADGLDQRGLRPAIDGARPDLLVRARLTQQQRSEQYTDYYDTNYGYGGYGPYGYGPGYGATVGQARTRTRTYLVDVLEIELLDPASGRVLWHSAAEQSAGGNSSERARTLRDTIRRVLASYPPS